MKKIQNSSVTSARSAEHFQFHYDALAVFTASIAETVGLAELHTTYKAAFDVENTVYLKNSGYVETKEIGEKNRQRLSIFDSLYLCIKGSAKSPVADVAAAGTALEFVVRPYKSVTRMGHAEVTGALTNLVSDITAGANLGHLQKLGLTDAVDALDTANNEFNTLYKSRSAEKESRTAVPDMHTIRPEVDAAYRACRDAINAMYMTYSLTSTEAEKLTALEGVIDGWNALLTQLTETLKARKTRAENAEEGDTPVTPDAGTAETAADASATV